MDRLRDYIGDFVAGTLFEKSLAKTFDMSNRHSRNIDLTVRLTYANTNLLLSTAVGALLFLLVQKGNPKSTLKSTYGSLDNLSLMPTHSQ